MKKVILVLMVAIMSLVLTGCGNDEEVEYIDYSGIYEYSKTTLIDQFSDEAIEGIAIYKYLGSEQVVEIPKTIDGKPVIYLGAEIFNIDILTKNQYVETLIISKNVMSIGGKFFTGAENLSSLVVDDLNQYYLSYNNGLYEKLDSGLRFLSIRIGDRIDYELHADTVNLTPDFNTHGVIKAFIIPQGTRITDVGVLVYRGSISSIDKIIVFESDYDYYVSFFTNYNNLASADLIVAKLSVVDPS